MWSVYLQPQSYYRDEPTTRSPSFLTRQRDPDQSSFPKVSILLGPTDLPKYYCKFFGWWCPNKPQNFLKVYLQKICMIVSEALPTDDGWSVQSTFGILDGAWRLLVGLHVFRYLWRSGDRQMRIKVCKLAPRNRWKLLNTMIESGCCTSSGSLYSLHIFRLFALQRLLPLSRATYMFFKLDTF